MNNPIKIYNDIRDAYLKYINSGLPFFRDEYNQERNELLKSVGTISQPPIIELVPKYSEYDEKTVLKLIAEKEIYRNLFLMLESNPSDTTDQIVELKYRTKLLEGILGWKNKDMLESNYGGIGFDLKLEYVFE